jgi:large subunit ribosomal protein L23
VTPDPYEIVKHPHVTEKTMDRLDHQNTLDFVVDIDASKPTIAWALEEMFDTEVEDVRTLITPEAEKRAIVRFPESVEAEDIAMRVGVF